MRPLLALAFIVSFASVAVADEKPVEIPLRDVWAANMPATRSIRELEPRTEGDHRKYGPLMHGIYTAMQGGRSGRAWGRPDAGPGFPVPGTGIEALNGAYDVLADNDERPTTVPAGEVSIVFFARQSGASCYLEKIEQEKNVITLTYRLHARREGQITGHLALIPLGELKPGKYEVKTVQLPMAQSTTGGKQEYGPPLEGERLKRTISEPFSFEVQ